MTSLTYVSSATHPFTNRELATLLAKCRESNSRNGITGMLLYKDGTFMQVLEGPPAIVKRRFMDIRLDHRHEGLITLTEQVIETRKFSDWSMAFWNLNTINPSSVPGYADFADLPLLDPEFKSNPSRAQELMLALRNSL